MSLLGFFAEEYKRLYAFCPTGEGGGIDNSCSPTGDQAKDTSGLPKGITPYAGADGLDAVSSPKVGSKVWTTHPDTGKLQQVLILGSKGHFDNKTIWQFKWLNGPDAEKEHSTYTASFWAPLKKGKARK